MVRELVVTRPFINKQYYENDKFIDPEFWQKNKYPKFGENGKKLIERDLWKGPQRPVKGKEYKMYGKHSIWHGYPEEINSFEEYNVTNQLGVRNCAEFAFIQHELSFFTFNEASKSSSFYFDYTNYIWCENPVLDA